MSHLTDWDITVLSSVGALAMSMLSMIISDQNIMAAVSSISAIILCLTAIVKFVDLVFDKWKKWTKKEP